MDVVTHSLVGVALARAGGRRASVPGATVVMVVASNLCDVDVLSSFAGASAAMMARRTLTHSVVGVPLLCLAAAWVLWTIYRHFQFMVLFGAVLLGCVVHVLLDLLNSYGVALLAPFSSRRFGMDAVFVVDPILTGLLVLPVSLAVLRRFRRPQLDVQAAWQIGLVLVVAYGGFCIWNRAVALEALGRYVRQSGQTVSETSVKSEPLGPHRWSGIIRSGSRYETVLISSVNGVVERSGVIDSMVDDPRVMRVREDPRAQRAEVFMKAPVWRADGNEVVVRDLRFTYQVLQNTWDPFRVRFKLMNGQIELDELTMREVRGELGTVTRQLGRAVVAFPGTAPLESGKE